MEVLDSAGTVVRRAVGPGGGAPAGVVGRNTFAWDLRHDGAVTVTLDGTAALTPTRNAGPLALPGRYQVRVTVDGKSQTQRLTLTKGSTPPGVSDDDLRDSFDFGIALRDKATEINRAILDIRAMRAQVADRAKNGKAPPIGLAADVVTRRLGEAEAPLLALSARASDVTRQAESVHGRPNEQMITELKQLSDETGAALEGLRRVLGNEVAAFNRMLGNAQMPLIDVPERLRR